MDFQYRPKNFFEGRVKSSSNDLKWLHQFKTVKHEVEGEVVTYKTELFGDYYDGDGRTLRVVEEFLDKHHSETMDIDRFLLEDILEPIQYSIRNGVREIKASRDTTHLRQKKIAFLIKHVVPRIYHHQNFAGHRSQISRGVTGLLMLIVGLCTAQKDDKDDIQKKTAFLQTKEFLASVAVQIWSVCLYEEGIPLVENKTLAYMRQLAMMDVLDEKWNFAGGWERILCLLEERHGALPRIPMDKALQDNTDSLRQARNSLRCQILELNRLERRWVTFSSTKEGGKKFGPPPIYAYYPKCSAYMCSEVETPEKPHRLRCYKCHYYHWCSPACRQYSEEVADHHDKFCEQCPEECADECRDQMHEFLGIQRVNDTRDEDIKCHACGLMKKNAKSMNRCSKCKAIHYCSRSCQVWDWTKGGHRNKCVEL